MMDREVAMGVGQSRWFGLAWRDSTRFVIVGRNGLAGQVVLAWPGRTRLVRMAGRGMGSKGAARHKGTAWDCWVWVVIKERHGP